MSDEENPIKKYKKWTSGNTGIPVSSQYRYINQAGQRQHLEDDELLEGSSNSSSDETGDDNVEQMDDGDQNESASNTGSGNGDRGNEDHGNEQNIVVEQDDEPLHETSSDSNDNSELDDDHSQQDSGSEQENQDSDEDDQEIQQGFYEELMNAVGNDDMHQKLQLPLHGNTDKTLGSYIYDVTNMYSYNKLTKVCLGQILEMNFKYLPEPNIAPNNSYKYMKIIDVISPMGENFEKFFYCSKKNCQQLFGRDMHDVPCPICQTVGVDVFVMNSVEHQLKIMLEKRKLASFLEARENEVHVDGLVIDITDGILYKNIDRDTYDITLITNTDGFALSKSSKLSGWPHLAIIAEVPPHQRSNYLLFNGLWVGHDKPNMFTFYRPLVDELRRLGTTGFQWVHPQTNNVITSKVFCAMISTDAQARFPIQNIVGFSSLDGGCSWCELMGVRIGVGTGSATVYKQAEPPNPDPPILRSSENMIEHAQTATHRNPVHGVRGPCIMSLVPQFDCSVGFVSEYQHSFCLGVVKSLIIFMKDYDQRNKGFYIGGILEALDDKLKSIQTPDLINRPPRSLTDIKSWKASELRHFALYYLLEILDGEIEQKYLQALSLLVAAMYILLKEQVLVAEINLAKLFIQDFHATVEDLFEARNLTYNMHQLTHYADCVLNWGQLYHYSTFPFENANGMLQRLIHGTINIEAEVANSFKIVSSLAILREYSEDNVIHHYDELKLQGAAVPIETFPENIVIFLHQQNLHDAHFYLRARVHGIQFDSIYYTRQKVHCNCLAMYDNELFGSILLFCSINNVVSCIMQIIRINGKKFKINRKQYSLDHILKFTETNNFICIPVHNLKCTIIKLSNDTLCKPVNLVEINL